MDGSDISGNEVMDAGGSGIGIWCYGDPPVDQTWRGTPADFDQQFRVGDRIEIPPGRYIVS